VITPGFERKATQQNPEKLDLAFFLAKRMHLFTSTQITKLS